MQSANFVDRHCVRQARASRSVQEQDSLERHVHSVHVERLEHDLRRALSYLLGVQKRLFRRNPELRIGTVVPDHFHVVPIRVGRSSRGISTGHCRPPGSAHEVDT